MKNRAATEIRRKTIAGLQVGDVFEVTRTYTEKDVQAFAAISGDLNPIHFNPDFIVSKQMKGKICHGPLVASLFIVLEATLTGILPRRSEQTIFESFL